MKKTRVALCALALCLCTLFSSCAAAGIRPPALWTTIGAARDKGLRTARDLFEGNTRLIEAGESNYYLLCPEKSGAEANLAMAELQSAIAEKTGVLLPLSATELEGKHPIVAELLTGERKNGLDLKDSSYRVAFEEEKLYISASSYLMLTTGIQDFTAAYVRSGSFAETGYWAIPGTISHSPETDTVFDDGESDKYVIIRPDKAGEQVTEAVQLLANVIRDRTGKTVRIKTDFVDKGAQKEIVVGMCRRELPAEVIDRLDYASYYIGADENGFCLLGTTDSMVVAAVDAFIACFLGSGKPDIDAETKQWRLPTHISYLVRKDVLTLAKGGKTDYLLTYAPGASTAFVSLLEYFSELLYYRAGTWIPVVCRSQLKSETEKEIRVKCEEDPAGLESWSVYTQGESLIIQVTGERALSAAIFALNNDLWQLITEQNTLQFNSSGYFIAYTPYLLYIDRSYRRSDVL